MQIKPDRETFIESVRAGGRAPVFGEELVPDLDPSALYRGLFLDDPESFLFESFAGPDATTRYSLMGKSNSRLLRIERGVAQFARDGSGETVMDTAGGGLERMRFGPEPADCPPHFWGGWVGYVGYEAGQLFEDLPQGKKSDVPDLYFMQVERLAVYDHKTGILRYIAVSEPGKDDYDRLSGDIRQAWERIRSVLHAQGRKPAADIQVEPKRTLKRQRTEVRSNLTRPQYMAMVEKAKAYISEGDIYQANLAQRFETEFDGDPFDLYLRLRAINPSPFSGFLKFRDLAIVSSSPERLVKVEDDRIETRPIAGTRPRGKTVEEDHLLARDLLLNEKEKAEHLMLVDLERNDLGRICESGSVRVTDLMFLEKYSHVAHIVSNIQGTLKPGTAVSDILRAVFPGGTITGCPKVRCMEIIDELEPVPRGPYSGSLGYIGFARYMDLNIVIRSVVVKDGRAYFHAGAGIVADSDPEREYQETLDKAAAMMAALCP
ncbi:MAG: aminodeoxychorismate synthase component I [Nitrospinae bacterium]|nr:aminodeoxychorismate synthase component I [Nitrospinota bacterium]